MTSREKFFAIVILIGFVVITVISVAGTSDLLSRSRNILETIATAGGMIIAWFTAFVVFVMVTVVIMTPEDEI